MYLCVYVVVCLYVSLVFVLFKKLPTSLGGGVPPGTPVGKKQPLPPSGAGLGALGRGSPSPSPPRTPQGWTNGGQPKQAARPPASGIGGAPAAAPAPSASRDGRSNSVQLKRPPPADFCSAAGLGQRGGLPASPPVPRPEPLPQPSLSPRGLQGRRRPAQKPLPSARRSPAPCLGS